MVDLYFWRQMFILLAGLFCAVSVGFMQAFPSVLSPALLAANGTDVTATASEASWIAASNGIAGMFGFFILSPIMQVYGRKVVHICANMCLVVGWIIFSVSHSVTLIFIARIVQGIAQGSIYINSMIVSEYSHPKRRAYFVILKKFSVTLGILMCHASSLSCNWRQMATFSIVIPILAVILTLFWPESPSYLALKGRFEESEKSFVWLHGGSNMKELHVLHSSQMKNQVTSNTDRWYKSLFRKDFWKPFMIVSILTLVMNLGGKYYLAVYVIQIMVELIGIKSIAIYCSIGSDLLMMVALISSCFLIRRFKRRKILFSFGIITVVLMLFISFTIKLRWSSVVWLTPALILLHSFLVNFGLIPVCFAIIGEVFPLEHKGCGSCGTGVVFTLLYTLSLKITPIIMDSTGVEGIFAIYGASIAICLVVLNFVVPETKDRTLQDIENEFKGIKDDTI